MPKWYRVDKKKRHFEMKMIRVLVIATKMKMSGIGLIKSKGTWKWNCMFNFIGDNFDF